MNASLFKIKIMPTSPEVNLEAIKKSAEKIIKKEKGKNIEFEEEPIAFGLNAVIVNPASVIGMHGIKGKQLELISKIMNGKMNRIK